MNFIEGTLALFTSPIGIAVFFFGLFGGLFVGAVPGLSVLTLGAVLLPFTVWLPSEYAIMLYGVLYVAGVYGGAITAILFNIPGSVENTPTSFDGYPMARKGQASKAIGLAMTCSAIGGVTSAIILMVATIPIASIAVKVFGPIEIFAVIVFALAVVTNLGSDNVGRAWVSLFIGLLLACVGSDPVVGEARFSFGSMYLIGGISFIPVILGLFALSEVFLQGMKQIEGKYRAPAVHVTLPTLAEFMAMRWVVVRSGIIGWISGLIPGVGATFAAFFSYNEAARWSPRRKEFGTGVPEGVVAPETANNAATGTAMIPLLALGLPGGAVTAMMIGVFNLHDIQPGPLIMALTPDLVWTLFASMFWASLAIMFLGLVEAKSIVHLLRIPMSVLAPLIVVFTVVGAYALRGSIVDVYTMVIAGLAGFFLRRWGYSVAAIVMGLILGELAERSLTQAYVLLRRDVTNIVDHPLAFTLLVLAFLTVAFNIWRQIAGAREDKSAAPAAE